MSGSKVSELAHRATLPTSPGGKKVVKAEMAEMIKEAKNPEADDQIGPGGEKRTVKASEANPILALESASLSFYARRELNKFKAELPQILQGDSPVPGGDATPLTPASSRRPVFINADGWLSPRGDVTGMPAIETLEEGFYRTALLISQAVQSGGSVPAVDGLSLQQKAKLIENAISMIKKSQKAENGVIPGLSKDDTANLRSSASTILHHLATKLAPSGTTAQLRNRIHEALSEAALGETDKFFGRHLAKLMLSASYLGTLAPEDHADTVEIFKAKYTTKDHKFNVKNILDAQGYIDWEMVCGQGEGFYESFLANLKGHKFMGANFKKNSSGDYQLDLNPPRTTPDGTVIKGIKCGVRLFNNDMMDDVGKRKGFSYGGHSDIGENQENSMEKALLQRLKATSPQLAVIGLCAGLDNLDDDLKNLGDIEVLTTFDSSMFWKGTITDENGNQIQGVTDSEDEQALFSVWESLILGENYDQMEKRCDEILERKFPWVDHGAFTHYSFPTIEGHKKVRWMHLDGDGDGRMDANDTFYQFGLKRAQLNHEQEFILKDSGIPFEDLEGSAIKNAILDLNVSTHYNSETHNLGGVTHKFLADGFFEGDGSNELVRFGKGKNVDGTQVHAVSYNSRLAHTTREALEALTQYMAIVDLSDKGTISGLSEVDRKLMGLTFAAFRLNYDGQDRFNDQRIWKQLLGILRLPADLPYGSLASLLDGEHHDYSGNMNIVNQYKQQLSASSLQALALQNVGRPAQGPAIA